MAAKPFLSAQTNPASQAGASYFSLTASVEQNGSGGDPTVVDSEGNFSDIRSATIIPTAKKFKGLFAHLETPVEATDPEDPEAVPKFVTVEIIKDGIPTGIGCTIGPEGITGEDFDSEENAAAKSKLAYRVTSNFPVGVVNLSLEYE